MELAQRLRLQEALNSPREVCSETQQRHKTTQTKRGPRTPPYYQHEPGRMLVHARTLHISILQPAVMGSTQKTTRVCHDFCCTHVRMASRQTTQSVHPTRKIAQVRFSDAHVRMILDVSVFPAPDSPDTTIDWLAALRPAPRRIWWYASCKTRGIRKKWPSTRNGRFPVNWCEVHGLYGDTTRFNTVLTLP